MSARHLAAVPATSRCSPPFLHPSPRPAPLHAKKTSNLALQDNYATIQPCMAMGITLEPADRWSRNLFTGQQEGFGRVFSGLTLLTLNLYIPHSHLTKFLLREEMVNGLFHTFGLFSLIKQNFFKVIKPTKCCLPTLQNMLMTPHAEKPVVNFRDLFHFCMNQADISFVWDYIAFVKSVVSFDWVMICLFEINIFFQAKKIIQTRRFTGNLTP